MSQSKLERLEEAIHGIKREIGKIGALRPGSLSKQARTTKTTYGAYWHLSYTHRGKGHTQYIRDAFVPQVDIAAKRVVVVLPPANETDEK